MVAVVADVAMARPRTLSASLQQSDNLHERNVNGITMYWCGTCTYWNSTHLTAGHKSANLAAAEGETTKEATTVKVKRDRH
jgi:hypothetical protein